jgi:hypothetical protein
MSRRVAVLAVGVVVLLLAALAWELRPDPEPVVAAAERPRPRKARPRPVPAPSAGAVEIPEEAPEPAEPPLAIPADEVPRPAAVYGRVHGAEKLPEGAVSLEGCGLMPFDGVPVDADGEFFAEIQPGGCQLRAWRLQGALRLPGPWVEVDSVAGADTTVDLTVPSFEPAGMGITFRATGEAVRVLDARPGTPAAEAGLSHGDSILLIDGTSTAGMDQEDFLQMGIGPAGSSVRLEGVTADGEPFDVTMKRRPISLD